MKDLTFLKHTSKLIFAFAILFTFFQCSEEEEMIVPEEPSAPEVIATSTGSALSCAECTYVIPADQSIIDGKELGIKPGDVIALQSGVEYNMLTFQNIVGTADQPVRIINCGGKATVNAPEKPYVIRISDSQHFRITGGDTDNEYGIALTGSKKNGLVIGRFTTDFEVDHLDIFEVGFAGIMVKMDPGCDDATTRENFTMKNVALHHNNIHHTEGEGFYIGHSSYEGAKTPCGQRMPHTIENIEVYNNKIAYSGWDGLQISSATKGVAVYNNIVEHYGTANNGGHNHGIQIGGGTTGTCYNNTIKNGTGAGMAVFGRADNLVYNNVIVNAGDAGIFVDERSTELGSGYKLINNTIINPATVGITFYSERSQNYFINNIVVNPHAESNDSGAYVRQLSKNMSVEMSNNYFTTNIDEVKFINVPDEDYRLTSGSPAINKGMDITSYHINKDYYNSERLKGEAYDIGASEQ